ncbi:hypothetical protein [Psychrobacter sp. Ps7]|uniref:hypothetical protein n=1 Tax=Psychrobacter sp. Ps7 TaxID=2790961 RepID=UPI001EE0B142|nr:hypothetical protein [Psychrobacter sp. Ps7]MCG3873507.1 hypothetical protein [Psychrobacter sp. Ps7]
MMNEGMWVLWRLSTQEKLEDNTFECHLILEYRDHSPAQCIDINALENLNEKWLNVVRKESPFGNLSDTDIPMKDDLSLFISCFINVYALLEEQPQLECIYLLTSETHEPIHLETLYPLSQLKDIETRNLNKIFVQLYPKIPSERFEALEDPLIEAQSLTESLAIIRGDTAKANAQAATDLQPPHSTESTEAYAIEKKFSKQDLKDLRDGFHAWQRAHGKNEMVDRLPESLLDKIGDEYDIAFWTSGQGVSNMVRDYNPPRHTMVFSIIQKSNQEGLGYCIQRPTSLDRVWTHKRWHNIKCSDSEILEVSALER